MPIRNTSGAFNIGRDITLVLIGPTGQRVELPNVMGFDCKQETITLKLDRLDSVQMHAELPKGWTGSFELERGSADVDRVFAAIEQNWVANGVYNQCQIIEYIIETDESTSTFAFDNVSLKYSDAGAWKGDASVKQKVEFTAWRRRPQ